MDYDSTDLHSLSYVSPIDYNLCCPICRSALVEPVYTSCLHTFCSSCITEALRRSQTCPVDRKPLTQDGISPAPIMISNLVNDLIVFCPNSELGCTFTCARYLLEGHLTHDCGHVRVECYDSDCQDKVFRKDAGNGCLHKKVTCESCFDEIRGMDLEEHEKECAGLQSHCKHCNEEFSRNTIKEHESKCEEASIRCDSHDYGCPWTGFRKDLSSHMVSCPFTLLRPVLQAHTNRLSALELQNRSLRKKIDLLSPLRTNTNDSLSIDDQAYHLFAEQEHMRTDIERLSASIGELEIKQGMLLMNESLRTKEELAGIRAAINGMRMQIHWLLTARVHAGDPRHGMGPGVAAGPATVNAHVQSGSDPAVRRLSDSYGLVVKL